MKFIDVLRKLGILRFGATGGTYKNYKEMPDELMYDNVYDKKKDLVGGEVSDKENKKNDNKIVFFVLLALSVLLIIFVTMIIGFGFWFVVLVVFWLLYLVLLFRYKNGLCSFMRIFWLSFIFVFFVVIFVFRMFVGGNGGKAVNNIVNSGDCRSLADKYDGKVLKIYSREKFQGQIGIKIDKASCQYEITWQEIFEAPQIVKNVSDFLGPVAAYNYAEDIIFAKESFNPADGTISPVFANKDALPIDPFNYRVPFNYYSTKEIINNTDKNASAIAFSHVMQQTGTFSQSTIDEILAVKEIKIFSVITDTNSAVKSGSPIAEFEVSISE